MLGTVNIQLRWTGQLPYQFFYSNSTFVNINYRNVVTSSQDKYLQFYQLLGLKNQSSKEEVREAFIQLAKKYHPDSQHIEANGEKFAEIEFAYRNLQEKFSNELNHEKFNLDNQEIQEKEIKHTVPQHRQFLSFGGVGHGTPFQREKQYKEFKIMKAVENVHNFRVSKIQGEEHSMINVNAKAAKKIQSQFDIERLVEDLIQESMAKGKFDNLKGFGKPLPDRNHNPYVDTVTHKINQVLIENGFSPQWVVLEKEIRVGTEDVKNQLQKQRLHLGPIPLNAADETIWKNAVMALRDDIKQINKKIDNFNLSVPSLNMQKAHVNLEKLSNKILQNGPFCVAPSAKSKLSTSRQPPKKHIAHRIRFFGFINSLWK